MKRAAIVGGTGYGALELIRLLQNHEHIEIAKIISQSQNGEYLNRIYPHMTTFFDSRLSNYEVEELKKEVDIIFFATPSGISKSLIPHFLDTPIQCVDLSGDLRLSAKDYEEWYQKESAESSVLEAAVFGLAEVYKKDIQHAHILSNPGCYPTAALLGLIPAVRGKWIQSQGIVIDAKSGVSGSGSSLSKVTHFSEMNDNVVPYKLGKHQHIPEIERYLSKEADEKLTVTFATHLIPMTRGILCTMYAQLNEKTTTEEMLEYYQKFYQQDPFIRIQPKGIYPQTKQVSGSNFCDIGLHVDERSNQLIIVSAIDNLVKGAAGQAIQNVNLMNGWDVRTGLAMVPMYV